MDKNLVEPASGITASVDWPARTRSITCCWTPRNAGKPNVVRNVSIGSGDTRGPCHAALRLARLAFWRRCAKGARFHRHGFDDLPGSQGLPGPV